MPIFTASIRDVGDDRVELLRRRSSAGTTGSPVTPRVFCAVSAVMHRRAVDTERARRSSGRPGCPRRRRGRCRRWSARPAGARSRRRPVRAPRAHAAARAARAAAATSGLPADRADHRDARRAGRPDRAPVGVDAADGHARPRAGAQRSPRSRWTPAGAGGVGLGRLRPDRPDAEVVDDVQAGSAARPSPARRSGPTGPAAAGSEHLRAPRRIEVGLARCARRPPRWPRRGAPGR